jgi:predicted nicotinamide N-methyase
VLELGAGSAVAGLAAAMAGAKVLLTDYINESIELCRYNAAKNNLTASYLQADWKKLDAWPHGADVVIGSEVREILSRCLCSSS